MSESILQKFGDRVNELRKEKGWTLEKLSDETGIHPSTISQIERGKRNLTLKNAVSLAEGLQVDPYQLFLFADHISGGQNDSLEELLEKAPDEKKQMMFEFAQAVLKWDSE